jgi:hypothetical protein
MYYFNRSIATITVFKIDYLISFILNNLILLDLEYLT